VGMMTNGEEAGAGGGEFKRGIFHILFLSINF
jgi:hypothetical protein